MEFLKCKFFIWAWIAVTAFSCSHARQKGQSEPVFYNAFSHNDYWQAKPLWDALSYRFNCVEADLWLVSGNLLVGHDRTELTPERTFENLYLKPLVELIKKNGGKVYPNSDRPFFLMVDCKTNGEELYPVLKKITEPYRQLFCSVTDGVYKEGAILLFLSGNRPFQTLPNETSRYVFLDGRVGDLSKAISRYVMPVISDNYAVYFTWNGEGEMPEAELLKMRDYVARAHAEGKLLRWWGAPDTKQFKRFFIKEGVDLIGTDDLKLLFDVLTE